MRTRLACVPLLLMFACAGGAAARRPDGTAWGPPLRADATAVLIRLNGSIAMPPGMHIDHVSLVATCVEGLSVRIPVRTDGVVDALLLFEGDYDKYSDHGCSLMYLYVEARSAVLGTVGVKVPSDHDLVRGITLVRGRVHVAGKVGFHVESTLEPAPAAPGGYVLSSTVENAITTGPAPEIELIDEALQRPEGAAWRPQLEASRPRN